MVQNDNMGLIPAGCCHCAETDCCPSAILIVTELVSVLTKILLYCSSEAELSLIFLVFRKIFC